MTRQPFPWFGGKKRAASIIWQRLGTPTRYIEPFFGGGAVALNAPQQPKKRVYNDVNGLLINAWRAMRDEPDEVWRHANRPIAEIELDAIHAAMREREQGLVGRLRVDHTYSDPEVAGWWLWGVCCSMGNNWERPVLPASIPCLTSFRGVVSWIQSCEFDHLRRISDMLRGSMIACGDWMRVLTNALVYQHASPTNITAIYLDPPYRGFSRELYKTEEVWDDVIAFCLEHGHDPRVRIVLSGYEGDAHLPGWSEVSWQAQGGWSNRNAAGNDNKYRERIWFSPNCLAAPQQLTLFEVWGL